VTTTHPTIDDDTPQARDSRPAALVVPVMAGLVAVAGSVVAIAAGAPRPAATILGGLALLVSALGALAVEREIHIRRLATLVREERARSEALVHDAAHDSLTGVLNRRAFSARLELALARARLHERMLAVLFLDLDGFKQINDTLGHDAGDRLLARVADRLAACLRGADAVGRFGGDEFAILLEDVESYEDAVLVAERVHVALGLPFIVDAHRLHIGTSVGIALSGAGLETPNDLISEADAAMYLAKGAGRLCWEPVPPIPANIPAAIAG
jgi:diguanylate cyclase (GGDEF)-like protein